MRVGMRESNGVKCEQENKTRWKRGIKQNMGRGRAGGLDQKIAGNNAREERN